MRKFDRLVGIPFAILLAAAGASAAQIYGDYLEVRSADVYTGPCVANAEVGLVGDQAILAWRIQKGSWDGVELGGLSVVGVVKAKATLGDPFADPYPARSVLIVDERADASQRRALESFARSMAGKLLDNVVMVAVAPIAFESAGPHGAVRLAAGEIARIETRCLNQGDHLCGNEEVYYSPLTALSHAMPAYTIVDQFKGDGLGVTWTLADKRSAFIGTFSR